MDAADPRATIEDTATWEAPPRRRTDPAAAPVLSVTGFEGPLDWLVELARTRRIDLEKISIVALINSFEAAMLEALAPQAAAPTLARWADWLVLAADLTVMRSRLLLPADAAATRDAEAEAETLRRLLLGRAALTAAADWLERRPQLGRDVFARGASDAARATRRGRAGDITALLRACLVALALPEDRGRPIGCQPNRSGPRPTPSCVSGACWPGSARRGAGWAPFCRPSRPARPIGSGAAGRRWRASSWVGSDSPAIARSRSSRRSPSGRSWSHAKRSDAHGLRGAPELRRRRRWRFLGGSASLMIGSWIPSRYRQSWSSLRPKLSHLADTTTLGRSWQPA